LQQGLRDLKNSDDKMLKDYQEMLADLLRDFRATRREMPWDEWLANVTAGFVDKLTTIPFTDYSISKGLRGQIDEWFDLNGEGMIDYNSAAYQGGYVEGTIVSFGLTGGKLAGGGHPGLWGVMSFSQMFPQTGH
jgi:hypothetical protein